MSDETFLARLAAKFERETQVYLGHVNVERAEQLRDIAARLAALTAENAQLRETLTLGLGEQESVIAGLRAENERLTGLLTRSLGYADHLMCPVDSGQPCACGFAEWETLARAALPSSRETTDG